jgi:squalene synthase HpnC
MTASDVGARLAGPEAVLPPPAGVPTAAEDVLDASLAAVLTVAPGENFPVSPIVLPADIQADLRAIYGFARLVDQVGDAAEGDRLALLDAMEADLDRIWSGTPRMPVHQALVATVRTRDLPPEPFHRLVAANRQDQMVNRYETFDDLVRYCTLSADPVGRLVLGVFGAATPERIALSDRICTALQLIEHLQDVAEDHRAGRIYLPRTDLVAYGVSEADLVTSPASSAVRALTAFQAERARAVLDEGTPLVRTVPGRLRLALAGFVGGGRAALDAIRRAGYDVTAHSPSAPKWRIIAAAAGVAGGTAVPARLRTARAASRASGSAGASGAAR